MPLPLLAPLPQPVPVPPPLPQLLPPPVPPIPVPLPIPLLLPNGKAIAAADGYIAATAKQHRLTVATRDTSPFFAADVAVFNPWQD